MRLIDADGLVYELTEMVRYNTGEFKYGIEAARIAAMEAPTIGGWISVKDRLPETETDVLAFLNDGIETRIAACNFANGVWYDCVMNCVAVTQHVTHWMPLPEGPKEATRDENC